MSKVAIVGAGFVGRAWAISFARAGHDVTLWDEQAAAPDAALSYIDGVLPDLAANDLLNGQSAAGLRARMRGVANLEEALSGADYVQENTPENVEIKRKVFARLDAIAGADTILASSTSAILPSHFSERLKGRARCLVVHPINPPYLIPAAEVVPAPWTDAKVVERAADFLRDAGHAPIVMKRELDGFVMNRMQGALLEEAFRLVEGGYASIEDVDIGIRDGLALRWSFMGPFETVDLNTNGGIAVHAARLGPAYRRMGQERGQDDPWTPDLVAKVLAQRRAGMPLEKWAERGLWRDEMLMKLRALRAADKA